ncbi:MAG TPA: GPP34 family phosphoprotein [Blastococcus sp.]|nr:GPP34 family phosphoprotein [Blastococcus sp.]
MDLSTGVAVRLAATCLTDDGRLREFDIWDTAARGALLVDLARAGRLVDEADSIAIDVTPTGFAPADRLLAAMEVEPERPLVWWLDHGGVRMEDVADAAVGAGRWDVRRALLGRRYDDLRPVDVHDPAEGRRPDDGLPPDDAAVTALATACGAWGRRPEEAAEEDLADCGPLRWICETVTGHLQEAQRRNLRAAGAADGTGSPYY